MCTGIPREMPLRARISGVASNTHCTRLRWLTAPASLPHVMYIASVHRSVLTRLTTTVGVEPAGAGTAPRTRASRTCRVRRLPLYNTSVPVGSTPTSSFPLTRLTTTVGVDPASAGTAPQTHASGTCRVRELPLYHTSVFLVGTQPTLLLQQQLNTMRTHNAAFQLG